MNVEQKNISVYFTNLKRTRLEELNTDTKQVVHGRGKKQADKVKLGDNVNYTIQNFFKFSKEEDCIKELKSDLKKLELNQSNLHQKRNSYPGIKANNIIDSYFKKEDVRVVDKQENLNENCHNVFTLDHINIDIAPSRDIKIRELIKDEPINMNSTKVTNTNNIYEDVKITNFLKVKSTPDYKGLNYDLFFNILQYLSFKDMTSLSLSCKTFRKFYSSTISGYSWFIKTDTSKYGKKDLVKMLEKTKNLKHTQKLQEVIKKDFGGGKGGSFCERVVVRMRLTRVEDIEYKGALFEAFHILPRKNPEDNFISNESVYGICNSSRFTLKDLCLRGCFKLNNKVVDSISVCNFLEKLELSNNRYIYIKIGLSMTMLLKK
jgi:hypothetical protein